MKISFLSALLLLLTACAPQSLNAMKSDATTDERQYAETVESTYTRLYRVIRDCIPTENLAAQYFSGPNEADLVVQSASVFMTAIELRPVPGGTQARAFVPHPMSNMRTIVVRWLDGGTKCTL